MGVCKKPSDYKSGANITKPTCVGYSLPGRKLPKLLREGVREGGSEGEIPTGNLRAG